MHGLKNLSALARDRIIIWLKHEHDSVIRQSILHLLDANPQEIEDAFGKDLFFGTAGIRRKVGPGTNRMNSYTIRFITKALLEQFSENKKEPLRIVIGYDTRQESESFSQIIAHVAVENGHIALLFSQAVPTPLLSFATRNELCDVGVMLTASHNTPEYNGYKVYLSDGSQIQAPLDQEICQRIEYTLEKSKKEFLKQAPGQLFYIGEEVFEAYLEAIDSLQFNRSPKQVALAYTSLDGSGFPFTPKALRKWGFQPRLEQEKQQILKREKSNPEDREALKEGIAFLQKEHCYALLANDPDADRIGLVSLEKENPYHFSGNEIALLILDYLGRKLGASCAGKWIAKSFVSTPMIDALAKIFHLHVQSVPTGFKYIAHFISELDKQGKIDQFLMGMEESSGILVGTHVRDKDGISTCCILADLAEDALCRKSTLLKELNRITDLIGFHFEETLQFPLLPQHHIETICAELQQSFVSLAGLSLIQSDEEIPLIQGEQPSFLWKLETTGRLILRASGTEPKLKCYLSIKGKRTEKKIFEEIKQELIQKVRSCIK